MQMMLQESVKIILIFYYASISQFSSSAHYYSYVVEQIDTNGRPMLNQAWTAQPEVCGAIAEQTVRASDRRSEAKVGCHRPRTAARMPFPREDRKQHGFVSGMFIWRIRFK